jgi:hypothetical protein
MHPRKKSQSSELFAPSRPIGNLTTTKKGKRDGTSAETIIFW